MGLALKKTKKQKQKQMDLAGLASGLSFQNFSLINSICCF
jgi:hypothetical protein